MRTARFAWLWLAAGVALGCSSSTSFHDDDETGGAAGAPTNTGGSPETGGTEGDPGGRDATGGDSNGGADVGGSGGSEGGSDSGGTNSGGADTGGQSSAGTGTGGVDVGGEAGEGGTSIGGTDTGGASGGGTDTGGAATGGEGGAGGGGADGIPVRGTVIDFWGHPIPSVAVDIGGTTATTDEDGQFTIAAVPDRYDVTFVVEYQSGGATNTRGWAYLGLTRRDPTLQVYDGLDRRSGEYSATQTGGDFSGATDPTWTIAFGGNDGAGFDADLGEAGVGSGTTYWYGSASTTATVHALLWYRDVLELPTYLAYDSQNVALSTTNAARPVMDLGGNPLDSGTLVGSVVPGSLGNRGNAVYLRFPSGAAIPVVEDAAGLDDFTYVVPALGGASLSVAASEGDSLYGPFALAHADGLTSTATPALTIPEPAAPHLPAASATNVSVGTEFAFVGASGVGGHLVHIMDGGSSQGLYVVTDETSFTFPEVAGFALRAGGTHSWTIETHGDFATVDEMTGSNGFLDAYSFERTVTVPQGRRTGAGTHTISAERDFVTAP